MAAQNGKRAVAAAMVATGASLNAAARATGIKKSNVSKSVRRSKDSGSREIAVRDFAPLFMRAVEESLKAHLVIVTAMQDMEWVKKQNPADIAVLYGVSMDKAGRMAEMMKMVLAA